MDKKINRRRSVQIRVDAHAYDRIAALIDLISERSGIIPSRSDVIGAAMDFGLDIMEIKWQSISKQ